MKQLYKHIRSTCLLWFLVGSSLLIAGACAPREESVIKISGATMGTLYHVTIVNAPDQVNRAGLAEQISELLEQVNAGMSTYREDSELTLFNQDTDTGWVPVSPATQFTVAAALEISAMTDGLFDVTVAPLVDSWGFGPQPVSAQLPTDEQVQTSLQRVGYQMLHTRVSPPALRKDHPGLSVDLSAIAKGYAVDLIAEHLERQKINDYLVEIGGEIRVHGRNPEGLHWRIAIERPLAGERSPQSILHLTQSAVATSGDYRNFREVDGRRFSHTINPILGQPVAHKLASVTVLEDSALLADAFATALLVMGPDLGYEFAMKHDMAAIFVIRDGEQLTERSTPRFALRHGFK